jgi:molybdate transport system substrate-binding protein
MRWITALGSFAEVSASAQENKGLCPAYNRFMIKTGDEKEIQMKRKLAALLVAVMAVGLVGCGSSQQTETTTDATEADSSADESEESTATDDGTDLGEARILVAAAASLKNAYEEELIPMFEEQYPGVTVEGTYDSSGKLQTQIEAGLDADVFMSAATTQMTTLDEEGLIASDTIVDLLENKIVLIVPAGSDSAIASFEDIANADSIALGDPESVPVGQYSKEALTNLGIWDQIQDKVSFGTNVTEVLNQVAAASADAGIVYATDAASMPDDVVVVAEAPAGSLETPVIYPVAVVAESENKEAAQAFVDFLGTDEAIAVFEAYGFTKNN